MAEKQQQEIAYPYIQIAVGIDGIVLETFYSPQISMKMVLGEQQVNEILKAWVVNRKELQEQQQLAQKVKRETHS
jgi:hypothetical protein